MKYLRIKINSWTSSFRYPIFVAGYQPTLKIPPLSTLYGLLSSVKGEYVTPEDTKIGFLFFSKGLTVDLESIYELESNLKYKTNVCKREILFDNEMYLYVENLEFKKYFEVPNYPVLLGRSSDVAMITEIAEVEMKIPNNNVRIGKTLIPFPTQGIYGHLLALPQYFTNTIPREAIGTRPYYMLDKFIEYSPKSTQVLYDEELEWGVWIHE